ncbi:helix-turn-helix domain-containing protein [Chitinophaga sp. Ak27]|uniref:helix-turn-helix domain-containing protein n=1 Tax=Chitinophaga sp. Ak27 TaxID=2726116 RepID=UPI00145E8B94|nr:AraC family transcriptional regulator [Chitinophaga sp. Ak27]NLU94867.1 helix-turn-helix transcriptional regulator [Chitinophaga sp. Ak27]
MALKKSQLKKIIALRGEIDKDPVKKYSVNELVSISQLSRDILIKGFKEQYNLSLYHYQLHRSMEYAVELLNKGELVKMVALTLGYKTTGNFARAFHKIYKKSPSQWRAEKLQQ